MKGAIAALLAVLMALSLTACTKDHSAELAALQAQLEALEAWVRDGAVLTGEEDDLLTLNADATTFVEARLRPERTVRTINAQMRFLDEHDRPKGETFEEFVFEYGYENPVTEQWHESGTITVYVEAVVPRGYVIDHWVINDVPYDFNKTVSAFTVVELDESTVYEAVLREAKATPTPKPTEEPVMYRVSCMDCSFDGKTSGMVPAGTVITVRGNYSVGDFEVNDSVCARNTSAIAVAINEDNGTVCKEKLRRLRRRDRAAWQPQAGGRQPVQGMRGKAVAVLRRPQGLYSGGDQAAAGARAIRT